ncbi:MAG: leucine-rich repeat domain-containing protein [Clostridia bacterium]|nr:leucine-rich repeat domain-containing protein [Clostridia bacterium]
MSVFKFSKFCACVLGLNFVFPFCSCPKVNAGSMSGSSEIPNDDWHEGLFKCSTRNYKGGCLLKIELDNKDFCKEKLNDTDKCVIDVLANRPEWRGKITKIEIGEGIQWIGDKAFRTYYEVDKYGKERLKGYINLKSVTLPNSLSGIGTCAFRNTGLQDITIPKSVRRISDFAFYGCKDLLKVKIEGDEKDPSLLEVIGFSVFSNCESMLSFEFPRYNANSVRIGTFAFGNCSSLPMIDIPNKYDVSSGAFYKCPSLTCVKVGEGVVFRPYEFGECCNLIQYTTPLIRSLLFPAE